MVSVQVIEAGASIYGLLCFQCQLKSRGIKLRVMFLANLLTTISTNFEKGQPLLHETSRDKLKLRLRRELRYNSVMMNWQVNKECCPLAKLTSVTEQPIVRFDNFA